MRLRLTIEVTAVRAERTTRLLHDGGILTIQAGDWLVGDGTNYGPTAVADLALLNACPLPDADGEAEARLRRALQCGCL